ncbi:MAG: hypothetical protein WB946_09595 [Halobacteriota archaeon]
MTDDRFLAGAAGALLVALAVVMLGTVLAAYGTGYATVVRVNAHGEFWADAALLAGCAVFGAVLYARWAGREVVRWLRPSTP